MRYVFGYAGIPSEVYDDIYRDRRSLTGDSTEFVGVSHGRSGSAFEPRHARVLLNRFKERALNERRNLASPVGFAVIYVRADAESTTRFEEEFFPATLAFPVDWKLTGCSLVERRQSKNELFRKLLQATVQARMAIEALHKEVTERANRTPLLLPLRNFRSRCLKSRLLDLQTILSSQPDKAAATTAVTCASKAFETAYPLKKVEDSQRKQPCFVDDQKVEFHSPGSLLHGLPHPSEDHPISCILGGYRRLGAPFNPAFHYDCIKGRRGNLKGLFYTCHEQEAKHLEGNPHLNIAPNDFVR